MKKCLIATAMSFLNLTFWILTPTIQQLWNVALAVLFQYTFSFISIMKNDKILDCYSNKLHFCWNSCWLEYLTYYIRRRAVGKSKNRGRREEVSKNILIHLHVFFDTSATPTYCFVNEIMNMPLFIHTHLFLSDEK